MEEKKCTTCLELKPYDMFYANKAHSTGRCSLCKACMEKRAYGNAHSLKLRRIREKKYRHTAMGKEKARIKARLRHKQNPVKGRARCTARRAFAAGKLIKPSVCSGCGKERTLVAHHEDYQKPLDVMWLCCECHVKLHINARGQTYHDTETEGGE